MSEKTDDRTWPQISVYMGDDLMERVNEAAKAEEVSNSEYIREAVKSRLQEEPCT